MVAWWHQRNGPCDTLWPSHRFIWHSLTFFSGCRLLSPPASCVPASSNYSLLLWIWSVAAATSLDLAYFAIVSTLRCFMVPSFAPTLWPSVHSLALSQCWSSWSLASALSLLLLPHLSVSRCTASHLYMQRCLFVSFSHPKHTNTNISLYGWPVPWLKMASAGHYQLCRLVGSLQTYWLWQY